MLAKDLVRLETLRFLSAAFTNELVAKGRKPTEELSDEEALTVIKRLAKQRKDSMEQFGRDGREDLVAEEKAQLEILEEYLPRMMEEKEIQQIAEVKKRELGLSHASDKGKLMKELMKELGGKAEGGIVKKIVDSLF